MKLHEISAVDIDAISTGSTSLDLALGIGGIPRGRMIEIYGPESSGKTTLALHIIAEAQKAGGVGAFMMMARKWDRLELQAMKELYDVFRAIGNDKRNVDIIWLQSLKNLDDVIQVIRKYQQDGKNIYVGINARNKKQGRAENRAVHRDERQKYSERNVELGHVLVQKHFQQLNRGRDTTDIAEQTQEG